MNKILAITNGNIGDFVMASSALKLLRQNTQAALTLIVTIKVKPFIEKLNFADEIIYTDFSFSKNAVFQRAAQIVWLIKNYFRLKKAKFDACIFLDHSRFLAKAIALIGIKNIIGPSTWWCGDNIKNPNIKMLTHIVDLPPNSDNLHLSQRYQTIIRNYLNFYNLSMPALPKSVQSTKDKIAKLLSRSKKYAIAFALRGDNIKGNKKIYPPKHVREIIKTLASAFDIDFYFLGTKDFFNDLEQIKESFPNLSIRNLCGQTKLSDLKPIFEQIDLLISVDTGIIHIAAAANVKIIGLYGANLYNSFPMSYRAIILGVKQFCSPCHYSRTVLKIPCPYGDEPKCLSDIKPHKVIEAVKKQLES